MKKSERHEAIRERARAAIRDLHHNATPDYPRLDDEQAQRFQGWFDSAAEFEIEYLQDGGAYGKDYRKTLAADCNAGKYKSEKARAYYIAAGMRKMRAERERCNALDSREHPVNCLWERISEFGKLYTWGRGGRTLAPKDLVKQGGGGSFSLKEDYCDEMPIAECVETLRIIESFNRAVEGWCKSVPEQWREQVEAEEAEERAQRNKERAAKAKETRERNFWAARDVVTR